MTQHHIVLLPLVLMILVGCSPSEGLERFPTDAPHGLGLDATGSAAPSDSEPTPIVTAPPALALPDPTGASIACEANTLQVVVPDMAESQPAVLTRIAAHGEWLYLLMNGGLYRAPILTLDAGVAELEPVLLPGDQVARRPVQELVDLEIDPQTGRVIMLDKVGHVIRWQPDSENASLIHRMSSLIEEPETIGYNLMSVGLMDDGTVIILDASHGEVWRANRLGKGDPITEAPALQEASELAMIGEQIYFLTHDGAIRTAIEGYGSEVWRDGASVALGLSLRTSNHLGIPMLVLVDGLKREITGMNPDTGDTLIRYLYDIEGMGLLRDAVFAGGRLYAISDNTITVYPGPASGDNTCETPVYDSLPSAFLYGVDVLNLTDHFAYPINGGSVPVYSRLFPGAARAYRMGVHHGVDIYGINAPFGFDLGYPVEAMAAGTVVRASLNYDEVSEDEFNALIEQTEALGLTPPDLMERFEGRQIAIDHGNGIMSVYAHLDSIASEVVRGAKISAGQVIGTVGVSGTSAEGDPGSEVPHLHFEIWINGRYLGDGLTIRETMWWYEQIFLAWMLQ